MQLARVVTILATIFALTALPACKGDRVKCEKAARNFAELMFWKKANADIAALPEAERALAREKKVSAFTNELESKIDFVTQQCVSANNDKQVDCMIAAKTADEVSKCADLVPNEPEKKK